MKIFLTYLLSISFLVSACSSNKKTSNKQPTTEPTKMEAKKEMVKTEEPMLMGQEKMQEEKQVWGKYRIKRGDTLMWIAFNIYGDYEKWRSLSNANPNTNIRNLKIGSEIRYLMPKKKFVWNPKGVPHLVKSGETLGTISNQKYGTTGRWREIWDNNKPMIKNPDLIFTGFTIYYRPPVLGKN